MMTKMNKNSRKTTVTVEGFEIPTSWKDITYNQYMRMVKLELLPETDGVSKINNSISIVALILGISKKEIENLRASSFMEIQQHLEFLSTDIPKTRKTKWKFTPVRKLTMDKWLAYEKYSVDVEENLLKILSLMQEEYTEEEIGNMEVGEVLHGFFTLERNSNLSIRRSLLSLNLKMIKWAMNQKIQNLKKKLRIRRRGQR